MVILKNNLLNATRCGKLLNSEMNTYLLRTDSVKMSLTRGQSAWVLLNKNSSETQRSAFSTRCVALDRKKFNDWLVGFTDGDGSFSFSRNNKGLWRFTFTISQCANNQKALKHIKRTLEIGSVYVESGNTMACYKVGNQKHLVDFIIPIFDEHPLLTIKYFKYYIFRKALLIATNPKLTKNFKEKSSLKFFYWHFLD